MMEFPVDFYRDEVRCGFYIPTAIKQAWAAGLTVLSEIDRICQRHGITYVADWGTVLGTVRHGGYVPWDDDFDICMRREDYQKFRAVADQELPPEYVIHDYERKEDHWLFLARVVNNSRISFEEGHLNKYHNFPYLTGVDIFLQDNLYRDSGKEKARCDEIMYILAVAESIIFSTLDKETQKHNLDEIERRYHVRLDRNMTARDMGITLYRLAEQQMARVPNEEADEVGQIFPWILKGAQGLPKTYYENIVRLPYENITMPVPAAYHSYLSYKYGNYLEVHKIWGGHDYPYFEGQRRDLQKIADFELPEYEFDRTVLTVRDTQEAYRNSIRGITRDCLAELRRLYDSAVSVIQKLSRREAGTEKDEFLNMENDLLQLLENSQQLAVDLGSLVENVKGASSEVCGQMIGALQEYCDRIYEVSQDINGIDAMKNALHELEDISDRYIISRKEILFLATGPMLWHGYEDYYQEAVNDSEVDVYVVALPMLFKDYYGRIRATEDELHRATREEEYPENVVLTSWQAYDISLHYPSEVYIQDVYDDQNPCLTIPAQYYTKCVREYTNHVIYIPPFRVDEFTSEDELDMYNMKHYVTAPGIVYADTVMIQSENMKERYLDKLCDWAGEDTRSYWNEKLTVIRELQMNSEKKDVHSENNTGYGNQSMVKIDSNSNAKKKLLYVIGVNELAEQTNVVQAVRKRMEIMKESKNTLDIAVALYPPQREEWKVEDETITEQLMEIIDEYTTENWCVECNLAVMDWDHLVNTYHVYYGSTSPLVLLFNRAKRPVMIADYAVIADTEESEKA